MVFSNSVTVTIKWPYTRKKKKQNLGVKSWTRWLVMERKKSLEASKVLDAFIFPTPDVVVM